MCAGVVHAHAMSMAMSGLRLASWWMPLAIGVAVAAAACGSSDDGSAFHGDAADGGDASAAEDAGNFIGQAKDVASITIDPPTASVEVLNGAPTSQPFKAIAKYNDGSTGALTSDVIWNVTNFQVGAIDGKGLYKTSGAVGGLVTVSAQYKTKKATAQLTVKLHMQQNPGSVSGAAQSALKGTTTKDASVVWAYPYDGTVFPRGLGAPPLMWNGGAAADAYYVHLTSPTFELESFTTAPPPASFAFAAADWQKFVDSTDGAAALKVARWDGAAATVVATHTWTIAPQSMRGTIYYWANNAGRVMRIKPGATAPDDFSAATFTTAIQNNVVPASSCTMTCHTVSADGSTLVSGGDSLGGVYDLVSNTIKYDTGGGPGTAQKRTWAMPAVSPNGKYVVENSSALPGPPGGADGLWLAANGQRVASSGLDGAHLGMPAFAPDGTRLSHVDVTSGALSVFDFDLANGKASNPRALVQQGAGATIAFPSMTPDAKWIIYHRGVFDTRNGTGDLYLANVATPGQEIRLGRINGDGYPFAAGARDLSWNFEPTFAPVSAGGYFWVVFTSRRTYGNVLTGDKTVVKQLWVSAIDLAPVAGKDPSHPPFRLPGQAIDSVNMRGFWALDPCKGDGQGCASGTECCGGYCDGSGGDSGGPVCKSQQTTCAQNGDRCQTSTDCCNASSGVTCINHVCSEPPPK